MAEAHLPPAQTAESCTTARPLPPLVWAAMPFAVRCVRAEKLATSCGDGGCAVRKPRALYAATRRSSAWQRAETVRCAPTRTVRTRRTVGLPGGKTDENAVGVRVPPPPPGMQPARGRNVGAPPPEPTYVATNTIVFEVVRPGATGLPAAPRNQTSIARSDSSASTPPTTNPFGHVSWDWTPLRIALCPAGRPTHGPATGAHVRKPRHPLVAGDATSTREASAESASAATTSARLTGPS